MFITLQFPLFDHRFFHSDPGRIEFPRWPEPAEDSRVRYFGEIIGRNKPYLGPWDDEKKYCNASSVLNFCGLAPEHFYPSLYNDPCSARILFRRFQSDGRCMAKFEVGINDRFEDLLSTQPGNPGAQTGLLFEYLKRYLLCPVKIKVGNQLTGYTPLVDAGSKLRDAYYWTTTAGKRTFDNREIRHKVERCEPALLIQVDAEKIDSKIFEAQEVVMPFLAKESIRLFYRHIPYVLRGRKYNLKTWIMSIPGKTSANSVYSRQFHVYNEAVRYLRINLLRIHVEICMQKKLLEVLGNTDITDKDVKRRLYFYLHKILLNLTNIQRNEQPQTSLVEAAFRLDEYYYGSMRIEDQVEALEAYKEWLSELNDTPQNQQVLSYVEKNTEALKDEQKNKPVKFIVFISYNHADKIAAGLLKNKLEKEGMTVLLDTASMQAGTPIRDFISQCILKSHAVLSLVSKDSLVSGWVGVETINAMFIRQYFPEKKFIACNLDSDCFKDGFVDEALVRIKNRISAINELVKIRSKEARRSNDYDDELSRLQYLDLKLTEIITHIKSDLCIDIIENNLDDNFPAILKAIRS